MQQSCHAPDKHHGEAERAAHEEPDGHRTRAVRHGARGGSVVSGRLPERSGFGDFHVSNFATSAARSMASCADAHSYSMPHQVFFTACLLLQRAAHVYTMDIR